VYSSGSGPNVGLLSTRWRKKEFLDLKGSVNFSSK
jgi:hypothetical protein